MERRPGKDQAAVRARLQHVLQRLATPVAGAKTACGRVISARTAAASRRCHDAATNELFTDIASAPDSEPDAAVVVPRLRLVRAG